MIKSHDIDLGEVKVAEVLIKNGANINIATKSGWTSLHEAAKYGIKFRKFGI